MKTDKDVFKKAFIATIPVLTGYIVLGIGFGLLLNEHGFGFPWCFSMSAFIYAGSMQYVSIGLLSAGAPLLEVALTTLMVNARHLFYGISMIDKYKGTGKKKPYLIFALTDETYTLVVHGYDGKPEDENLYYFLVSIFDQCYWITGSLIGCLLGQIIPFDIKGVDFALTALFVTVLTDQWISTKNHFSAIAGILCSVICLLIFGADNFLIPTMILITVVLISCKRFLYKKEAE